MAHHTTPRTVDAVVIGAGFGGIYAVHKLANELGLTVVGFDKADGPGGTWYWNRYPGALSDTESHLYRYSFDRDLLQDGSWKSTYITQPEILEYLEERRRTLRPGPPLPLRHRGRVGHLPRRRRSVGGHHRRRRRVSGHLCHQRGRTAVGHQLPEPARSGDVRGRDHPHRRLARGQGSRGPPRRRHRHRFHRPAGDHAPWRPRSST